METVNLIKKRSGFTPIGIKEFVRLHMKSNPKDNPVELTANLQDCLSATLAGKRCYCGEPIWVIGSAFVGHMCFTCMTGEAFPDEDYEIDEAIKTHELDLSALE